MLANDANGAWDYDGDWHADQGYSWGNNVAIHFRGGAGVCYNNTVDATYANMVSLSNDDPDNPANPDGVVHDVYIWSNYGTTSINTNGISSGFYLYAPSNYTAYIYPHPLVTASEYGEETTVTVTINSPTNTTFTVSTVSVSLSASGGTIDKIQWNCTFTNSTVVYANQTYTVTTSMTLENGNYIFNAMANNTAGNQDVKTVMFTVSVIGGTTQLIVNVWWANYW